MKKYDFNKEVNRCGTYCTQWDYAVDRFGTNDIIPFSISDMDIPLPQAAIKYLQEQLASGIYGYTRWNNQELLKSITSWYERRFNYKCDSKTIVYSPSVIYTIAKLIKLQSSENDGVLILTPAYDAFFKLIPENNRQLMTSELVLSNNQYQIDWVDFEVKIKKAAIFLHCSPHNPVGKVWSEAELKKIIEICKKHNVVIISDEIHMDFAYYNNHIPILKVGSSLNYQNQITIATSATKSFNFPSLQFSYAIIPSVELHERFLRQLKYAEGLSSCPILGMHATMYCYNNLESWLEQLKVHLQENLAYIRNYFKENELNLEIADVDGTYLIWIDATYYRSKFSRLKAIMYQETKVGIMDGCEYGKNYYLRINIGCPKPKLITGINRLHQAISILEGENK